MIYYNRLNDLKEKRTMITSKCIYLLNRPRFICRSGLTWAKKYFVSEFMDITIDAKRLCLVLRMATEDDLVMQVTNLECSKLETIDYTT